MKTNKKGFTITELVIVIVVIAILAAVLIPTFANLIKKANQSADIQAARQMNVALTAASAEEAPADFETVIDILEEAGYDAEGSLKPITKNHKFYWFKTENVILLVNEEEDPAVVVYPTEKKVVEAFAAVTDAEGVLFDLEVGFLQYVEVEVESADDVVNALNKGQSISLTEDVTLDSQISIPAGANTTIDLNGNTLTTAESEPGKHYYAVNNSGTVTVTDGTFNSRGIMNYSGSKLIIKDAVVNAVDDNGGGCIRNKGGEVVIDGGTFNVTAYSDYYSNAGGAPAVYNAGGTITINGGTFTSVTDQYLVTNLGGTITINGGDFSAYRGALYCSSGTITVNNGKFAVTNDSHSGWIAYTEGSGEIILNGGQFTSVVPSRDFHGDGIQNNLNK